MNGDMSKCGACGANLKDGLGVDSHFYQVDYGDVCGDGEIGDIIEYYCPQCGVTIDSDQAEYIHNEWDLGGKGEQ